MNRILIIIGNHSPRPSSVANCVEPLIKKVVSKGFEVDIVTDRKRVSFPKYDRMNNVNIYRVDDYRAMNTIVLNEAQQIESTKILKILTRVFSVILKGFYYTRYCLFAKEKQPGGWQTKEIVKKCVELHNQSNYNAVLSISQPFKSHYIAEKFLKVIQEPVKWFMFEFDPYSYNKEIAKSKKKRNRLLKDEYRMFEKCDKIFLTPELYHFYKKTELSKLMGKALAIPFAKMEPISYKKEEAVEIDFNSDKINCLFTGRLYKEIRNPSYALDLFSELSDDLHFTLLTNFTKETIKKDVKKEFGKFSILPLQSRDTALHALMKADILVNIGNTVEFQIPGKIFEYMSTGKPIIHFSKFSNDPALFYLKRYPFVFVVNEWERITMDYVREIEQFCKEHKHSKISFEQVSELFKEFDGESVANRFTDTLAGLLEGKEEV